MSESSGLSPEIAEHPAITISDARSASGAFKALISATDSSAPLSLFFVPAAMFSEFFGCRQDDGAVLVGDSGCGRRAFEWFDDRWRCSLCMVVRRGRGQAVR